MTSPDSEAPNSNQKALSDLEALSALQELLSELTQESSSSNAGSSLPPTANPAPANNSGASEAHRLENLATPEESPLPREIPSTSPPPPPPSASISSSPRSHPQRSRAKFSSPSPTPASPLSPIPNPELRQLQAQVDDLQQQLDRATDSMGPLMPVIQEILTSLSPVELRNEVIQALVPEIDRVIRERSQQNPHAMQEAFAEILPGAMTAEIQRNPKQIANAIGPEMGAAIHRQIQLDRNAIRDALAPEIGRFIKAQIELERDSMVDALYPVIGNTIAKYMTEAVRDINRKVENTLSFEGVRRKVRARLQGVSEAELILRESFPFKVRAAFLIHKHSGLVMCEAQVSESEQLESDMIGGMLTAIRSFASDCIVTPGGTSELQEIEYETFNLVMEVAGYCYVAVVAEGEMPKSFVNNLRNTLGYIVQKSGDTIENYDGDPETIPPLVENRLQMLVESANFRETEEQRRNRPPILLGMLGLLLLGFGVWGGLRIWQGRVLAQARQVLRSQPSLAVYRLNANMNWRTLVLSGEVPSESLRSQAEEAVQGVFPQRSLDNRILAVQVPPTPELTAAEFERTLAALNSLDEVSLEGEIQGSEVRLWGELANQNRAQAVTRAFEGIPGVTTVTHTGGRPSSPLTERIYFDSGATAITEPEQQQILEALAEVLLESPEIRLRVVGHTDSIGSPILNQEIAQDRAEAVQGVLIERGISADRLEIQGSIDPPPDLEDPTNDALSRTVRWEVL
ncbi:MAG: OmpA family protein [Phormidium sp. BM_Day4_Bin.17]|nr:OmpA family protein [Phormidium sp. BM_Day4_Bin.17]UCJ13150.1 MAG: OmpA family protein [Phormidium sp. PBR-2020]